MLLELIFNIYLVRYFRHFYNTAMELASKAAKPERLYGVAVNLSCELLKLVIFTGFSLFIIQQ